MREFILVSPDEPRVELFVRLPAGGWRWTAVSGVDQTIRLDSLGIDLPLTEVYAGVTFPPTPPDEVDG